MPTEVKGVGEMRKALRKFTPDLNKALNKKMRIALSPITQKARGYVIADPMTNWNANGGGKFPQFDVNAARRGIGYKITPSRPNRSGFVSLAEIYNKNAAGAIYETAGRKNPNGQPWVGSSAGGSSKGVSRSNNKDAGKQFIANLQGKSPLMGAGNLRGRAMFRAWREDSGKAQKAVIDALKEARDRFNGKGGYV